MDRILTFSGKEYTILCKNINMIIRRKNEPKINIFHIIMVYFINNIL
jgi:hypothetical protein